MPDFTVSTLIDQFMQSPDAATARSVLGIADDTPIVEVLNYSALPIGVGTPPNGALYLAQQEEGTWLLLNKRDDGFYRRVAQTGVRATDWQYMGSEQELANYIASAYQPLDADLTAIASLTPANGDIIRRVSGAWAVNTLTQLLAALDVATTLLKGLMSAADKTKLDGVATGATANSSDATLLSRANHTGTQTASTISDFTSTVQNTNARVALKKAGVVVGTRRGVNFIEGTNVTITVTDDAGNEEVDVTINASVSGGGSPASNLYLSTINI